jgi:hypothetical protein
VLLGELQRAVLDNVERAADAAKVVCDTELGEGVVVDDAHVLADATGPAQGEERLLELNGLVRDADPAAVEKDLDCLRAQAHKH